MKSSLSLLSVSCSLVVFSCIFLIGCQNTSKRSGSDSSELYSIGEPQKYFNYTNDGSVIVSGHRGGREAGYPENCIATFNYVLSQMPAFFEIDPRLTKDSIIVLMHDKTLDRTTTGTGPVSSYTWEELKALKLRDNKGNATEYPIPTLEEAILWSRGKTILNLDKKDVPMEMIVDIIKRLGVEKEVMLTVHNGVQAKFYYDHFPSVFLSAFARTPEEYADIDSSGVPWRNMIAYVGRTINESNSDIVKSLHEKGVRCMISVAPTHDMLETPYERITEYRAELLKKPDIIETDLPLEVWKAITEDQDRETQ